MSILEELLKFKNFLKEKNIEYNELADEDIGIRSVLFTIGFIEFSFDVLKNETSKLHIYSYHDADIAIEFLKLMI